MCVRQHRHAAQRRGQAHEWGFRHLTGCTAKHEGSRCTAKHEGVAAQPGVSQLRLCERVERDALVVRMSCGVWDDALVVRVSCG